MSPEMPQFKSVEEESDWWDSGEGIAFSEQGEAVEFRWLPEPDGSVSVYIGGELAQLLTARAREEGTTAPELGQRWLQERLR